MKQIERLREAFSVKNVRARYQKMHAAPCRNRYLVRQGDEYAYACLLGCFEHVAALTLVEEHDRAVSNSKDQESNTSKLLRIKETLVRAMEAGWEGWSLYACVDTQKKGVDLVGDTAVSWGSSKYNLNYVRLPLPKKGTPERLAYEHGQRLARVFKPVTV